MKARAFVRLWLVCALSLLLAAPALGAQQEQSNQNAAQQGQNEKKPRPAERQFGREVNLGELSDPACRDVYQIATQHALLRLNYRRSEQEPPKSPGGFTRYAYLARGEGDSARRLLVGLQCYPTQAARLYLWGAVGQAGAAGSPNPDIEAVAGVVQEAAQARKQSPRSFAVRDLLHETYQLSNIEPNDCVKVLGQLGYNTSPPGNKNVDVNQLPSVFALPAAKASMVVGISAKKNESDKNLPDPTTPVMDNRLLILYHPSQSGEVADLKTLLEKTVDVPAEQVLIEGMLIELTEDDLKELGAEWEFFGVDEEKVTFLQDDQERPFIFSFDPEFTSPEALANRVRTKIRILVQEGRAEVLSSPSVLVLDNRNAKIQVVEDVPIFESLITERTTNFKVRFERVGIVLNIKPRIGGEEEHVAMQIMVEVSEAPEEDRIVVEGQSIAPLINRRVVETVARVRDNTPFIIGGLIRNENSSQVDRIPVVSQIPILGRLFRRETDRRGKREVIIVLTPRIIQTGGSNRPVLPKDSVRFDFLNNRLFRNSYRLKADDVFDVGFLEDNLNVRSTMRRAQQLAYRNPRLENRQPFKDMLEGTIPGEQAVVVRMIYEIAKNKLSLHERIAADNIILFQQAAYEHKLALQGIEAERCGAVHEAVVQHALEELGYGVADREASGEEGEDRTVRVRLTREVSDGRRRGGPVTRELFVTLECLPDQAPHILLRGRVTPGRAASMNEDTEKMVGVVEALTAERGGEVKEVDLKPAGFSVEFLEDDILAPASPDGTLDGYFEPELDDDPERYPREVLFLRFGLDPKGGLQSALQSPTARLDWQTVDSREDVERRLLEMNKLHDDFSYHEYALVLDTVDDLTRLKTAIAMREIAKVNNIEQLLQLRNFRVGRKVAIPELAGPDERIFLADRTVAEFFYKSDYYYYALRQKLELAYDIIDKALAEEGAL